jgi:ribokinase
MNEDEVVVLDEPLRRGGTLLARELLTANGGKGLNQAVAAAVTGAPCALIGRVGTDAAGERVLDAARRAGVDVGGVRRSVDRPTGRAIVFVEPDGESTIAVVTGANGALRPEDLPQFYASDVVLAQLEVPVATVRAAFGAARKAGARSVLSLSPLVPGARELVPMADLLVCNRGEAASMLGRALDDDPTALAKGLLAMGVTTAVVTLGADGAVLANATGASEFPAVQPRVVRDTTGAGDAFLGALTAALAMGLPVEASIQKGLLAGARAVEDLGAQRISQ